MPVNFERRTSNVELRTSDFGLRTARDALTDAVVFVVIGGCAVTACLFPARRAAGVDAAVTLKDA